MSLTRRVRRGFTLVELMIVVSIISVLAATAIPAYIKYIKRSKNIEATMNIRRLFDSAVSYYYTEHADAAGTLIRKQFPFTQTWTPGSNACCIAPNIGGKCAPNPALWTSATWQALNFAVNDPHYFQYSARRVPNNIVQVAGDQFWVEAMGNFNCDMFSSFYVRQITITPQLEVRGAGGLYIFSDIE